MMNYSLKNFRKSFIKRSIGLDIGKDRFCAVQMLSQGQTCRVEKSFSTPIRRKDDNLTQLIRDLFRVHGFSRWAFIAVAAETDKVYYRRCQIDQQQPRLFPIDDSLLLCQTLRQNNAGTHRVKVATSKQAIEQRLNALKQAAITPDVITCGLLSVLQCALHDRCEFKTQKGALAHIANGCLHIAIVDTGAVQMVRQIPLAEDPAQVKSTTAQLISETKLSWQRLYGQPMEQDRPIYVINDEAGHGPAQQQPADNIQTIRLDSFADPDRHQCTFLSIALARSALIPDRTQANWLDLYQLNSAAKVNVKSQVKQIAALAGAAAVIALGGLLAHKARLENIDTRLDQQIAQTFEQALPDHKMVRPVEQLDEQLKQMRATAAALNLKNAGPAGFVQLLHDVIAVMPAQQIHIVDMQYTADKLTLKCRAQTFRDINQWSRAITDSMPDVSVQTSDLVRAETTGQISFTISIDQSGENLYVRNP